jgi:hypothetical protein
MARARKRLLLLFHDHRVCVRRRQAAQADIDVMVVSFVEPSRLSFLVNLDPLREADPGDGRMDGARTAKES